MDQQLNSDSHKKKRKRTLSKEAIEYELMNAHVANQTGQFEKAKHFLAKLEDEPLPIALRGRYYALSGETNIGLHCYEEAALDLEQALQIFERKGSAPNLRTEQVRNLLGLAYYYLNKHQLALEQHLRCLKAIQRGWVDDPPFKRMVYSNLANEYHHLGNHQDALDLYREALKLAEEGEDKRSLPDIYWGLGIAYRSLDNLDRAKLYLDKSAEAYRESGQLNRAGMVKNQLGLALVNRQEFGEAEVALESALRLAQEQKDDTALGTAYGNLAHLYRAQGNLTLAEQNAGLASELLRRSNNKVLLGQALGERAEIRLIQGATSEGLSLFEEALTVLEQTESTEYLKKICFRYATALEKIGNLAEAIKFFKRAYYYKVQDH